MAKTWDRAEPLIEAHIKDVSIRAIKEHERSFREFLGPRRSGIYVLRTDQDIYYIGLASSLRKRLPDHLSDQHAGEWDRFDLYVVRKNNLKYLRELETLLIRAAKPTGNEIEPNFIRSENLTKKLKQALEKDLSCMFPGL